MQGFPLNPPKTLPASLASETVSLWVARGPFSCRDDGDFEPLKTFLALAKKEKPSVLLLVAFAFLSILSSADRFFPIPRPPFSIFHPLPSSRRSGRSCAVPRSPRFSSPRSTTRSRSPRFRSLLMTTRQFRAVRAIRACWRCKACGSACRTATC